MSLMEELTERKELLYIKLKESNNQDTNIFNEYMKLAKLIEAIHILIKLEIKFEDIDMEEFEQAKENVFKNDTLDPIYPYFFGVEFLRDEADEIVSKERVYKYISDEIDKGDKFILN